MNKKSAILFFSVLFLLSLGALYVFGELKYGHESGTTTAAATESPSPWIKGGDSSRLINITVGHAGDAGSNITNVTIELDPANFSSWNFINVDFGVSGDVPDGSNASLNLTNVTYDSSGALFGASFADQAGDWACWNLSEYEINCEVQGANSSVLGGGLNTTLTLVLNVTGANTNDENTALWNITTANPQMLGGASDSNFTNVTAYIDAQSPRLIEVNISDGNTTYANASWAKEGIILMKGPLTVEALLEDSRLESTVLFGYNCNNTNATFNNELGFFETGYGGFYREVATDVTIADALGTIDHRGSISYTIDPACFSNIAGGLEIDGNGSLTFRLLANDSFNHKIVLNSTLGDPTSPFNITIDDGELLPVIAKVNVTQTSITLTDGLTVISRTLDHGTELDGSSDYLKDNTATFDIELTGGYKPHSVYILWNDTGRSTTALSPAVIGGTGAVFPYITNLGETAALNATNKTAGAGQAGGNPNSGDQAALNETSVHYNIELDLAGNTTHEFAFWVYANNTEQNYTRIGGPYRFQVDGGVPSITMTPPTDLVISPRGSITYSCKMADDISGTNKIMWELKKPGETVYTKKQGYENVGADGSDSITFTGDDTNLAGTYDVRCLAVDAVGNEGTYASSSSEVFSVHYSTAEGAGAAEGAGVVADLDFTTQEEITVKEKQGVITTFTLDGTTVHTIKIKTVDEAAGTVTIVIESDPITITLKIGETKEVDIDADGANDISVTLNGIVDGAADITTKRLTPLPTEKPTEEVPPTEKPEEITPPAEVPSKAWLWILVIVIIAVVGAGYWFMKRK